MLDNIRQQFLRLISAYEKEKAERSRLEEENRQLARRCETYGKQIAELEEKLDNLNLATAFAGARTDNSESKKEIDGLVKEIDRCISLLKG